MNKTVVRLLLLGISLLVLSAAQAQTVYKYWVEFTDKEGSPYRLERPDEFLGPRALERRARQGVAVDSLDLPVNPGYLEALRQEGCRVQNRSRWLNGAVAFVDSGDIADPSSLPFADRVGALPFVRSVVLCDSGSVFQPDTDFANIGGWLPDFEVDTLFGQAYYGWGYRQIAQLRGQSLHRAGFEGQGMIIGVCDCGFPGVNAIPLVEPMRREGRLLATRDFVWSEEDDVFSVHAHGTHCFALMAADAPGRYVGTAPKASYVLCRTENVMDENVLEEYNWVAAAEWLDSLGADIVTTSLGYFNYDDTTRSYTLDDLDGFTAPMSRAAGVAVSRGMLVLNSAGNDGRAFPQHLNVPADAPAVLSVGAVDSAGERATFSAHGPTATGCIKPDVMALGEQVVTATPDGYYSTGNGTSLACPVMAGMMACLWQMFPNLTPRQLCDSVRAWGSFSSIPSQLCGYGIPDFSRALLSQPVGIAQAGADEGGVCLFPNPAPKGAKVEVSCDVTPAWVEVYDVMGRKLFHSRTEGQTTQVALPVLPSGVYVVRVAAAEGSCRLLKLVIGGE